MKNAPLYVVVRDGVAHVQCTRKDDAVRECRDRNHYRGPGYSVEAWYWDGSMEVINIQHPSRRVPCEDRAVPASVQSQRSTALDAVVSAVAAQINL